METTFFFRLPRFWLREKRILPYDVLFNIFNKTEHRKFTLSNFVAFSTYGNRYNKPTIILLCFYSKNIWESEIIISMKTEWKCIFAANLKKVHLHAGVILLAWELKICSPTSSYIFNWKSIIIIEWDSQIKTRSKYFEYFCQPWLDKIYYKIHNYISLP